MLQGAPFAGSLVAYWTTISTRRFCGSRNIMFLVVAFGPPVSPIPTILSLNGALELAKHGEVFDDDAVDRVVGEIAEGCSKDRIFLSAC
jgi:hypothetical protein